jgi:MoxR-like ATPase
MTDQSHRTEPKNDIQIVQSVAERVIQNVSQVIFGKRTEIRQTVLGLLSEGHILIEDIPGVGKTTMTKALARSIGADFSRIQFTPDMLPSDVTGVSLFNPKNQDFEFRPGPIIAQIVLADEINRATPKTQAALLEAMEERQITVDGITHKMPEPFLILATQNPIEYEGTFPLPEAQLDRFLLRIRLGYPTLDEELTMLSAQQHVHPVENVQQVVSIHELLEAQQAIKSVYVANEAMKYIIDIVSATRHHPHIELGSSPRGSLALFRTAQTRAAMAGRTYVIPDDVKALAEVTLAHRIFLNLDARAREISSRQIIKDILASIPVPGASLR